MRTILLRALIALAIAVVVLVVASVVVLRRIPPEQLRTGIASELSLRLGLPIEFSGPLRLEAGLRPWLVAEGVVVRSASPRWTQPIARLERVELGLDLWRVLRRRELVLERLEIEGAQIELVRETDGAANWELPESAGARAAPATQGRVRYGVQDSLLSDVRVRIRDLEAGIELDVELDRLRQHRDRGTDALELLAAGRSSRRPFSLRGRVERLAERGALRPAGSSHYRVDLETRVGEAVLTLAGEIEDPRSLAAIDVEATLGIPQLDELFEIALRAPPAASRGLGPLQLRGRLVGGEDEQGRLSFALREIDFELGRSGSGDRLRGRGEIADLAHLRGLDLGLELQSHEADALLERAGSPRLGLEGLRASGRLRGEIGSLVASHVEAELEHASGVRGRLSGALEEGDSGISLALDAEVAAPDLDAGLGFLAALPLEEAVVVPPLIARGFGPVGPFHLRAKITGDTAALGASAIEVTLGGPDADWLRASGSVAGLWPSLHGVELTFDLGSEDFEAALRRVSLPALALERLRAHLLLAQDDGRLSVSHLQLAANRGDQVVLGLRGEFPDVTEIAGRELEVTVHATDLKALGDVFGRTLPATAPVDASARIVAEAGYAEVRGARLRIGESELDGDIELRWKEKARPFVRASIRSASLRLEDIGVAPDAEQPTRAATTAAAADWSAARDRPLPFADLLRVDARLDVALARLVGREDFDLRDIGLRFSLQDGLLQSEEIHVEARAGHVALNLRADARATPPEVSLRLLARGLSLERLVAQVQQQGSLSGDLELALKLESRGLTSRELIGALAGDVLIHAGAGQVSTRYSRALELEVLDLLDPGARERDYEKMNCLIGDFSLEAGRATIESLLFDSDVKQVVGTGQIDLNGPRLSLVLTPAFKKTIPTGVTTAVRVSGPLADPKVLPAPLPTAGVAARGLIQRVLRPARRLMPGVGEVFEGLGRTADRAIDATGVPIPDGQLWTPGVDISCEAILAQPRIVEARAPLGGGEAR